MGLTLERTGNLSNRPERAGLLRASLGQLLCQKLKRLNLPIIGAMVVILAVGIFLRIYPSAGFSGLGVDERAYTVFLKQIQRAGLINYDAVVRVFVEKQYHRPDAVVPATRIGFLVPAYLCGKLFHLSDFDALRDIACAASILTLILCAWFGFRLGGISAMITLTALVGTAPLQIYLAQRALIDGYFAFWAVLCVWLAWENLQQPRHWGWLSAYAFSLTMLVLTIGVTRRPALVGHDVADPSTGPLKPSRIADAESPLASWTVGGELVLNARPPRSPVGVRWAWATCRPPASRAATPG